MLTNFLGDNHYFYPSLLLTVFVINATPVFVTLVVSDAKCFVIENKMHHLVHILILFRWDFVGIIKSLQFLNAYGSHNMKTNVYYIFLIVAIVAILKIQNGCHNGIRKNVNIDFHFSKNQEIPIKSQHTPFRWVVTKLHGLPSNISVIMFFITFWCLDCDWLLTWCWDNLYEWFCIVCKLSERNS